MIKGFSAKILLINQTALVLDELTYIPDACKFLFFEFILLSKFRIIVGKSKFSEPF